MRGLHAHLEPHVELLKSEANMIPADCARVPCPSWAQVELLRSKAQRRRGGIPPSHGDFVLMLIPARHCL
eukprot:7472405-Pyramimonas_sp.AAC.1